MKEDTIRMLKTMKRMFKDNIKFGKKAGNWLEVEQWKTMLFAIEEIEKYEEMKFD